ncbi:uncharacterized protein LOC100840175 [Brachypodium distachyon]|uniref:GRF-type domain-containing protein n=1 Tax=Brachypodium distachyon TaxID=15368 RepID=A0A0Q3L629_BRADI|nr:uncharacterized protein LOC100840175 [Brachypodium distachyon]KQK18665.1 hypothetical protein BRADI_1g43936v3 [Brachypodium distachyon]|eukprot:XP_014752007.1 uncharacterized protein LOC100840175 [Brachypodium distachyon]
MSGSSSKSCSGNPSQPHLPLIICPRCGRTRLITNVQKKDGPKKGKRFYKCPTEEVEGSCRYFAWEEDYTAMLDRITDSTLAFQHARSPSSNDQVTAAQQPQAVRNDNLTKKWGTPVQMDDGWCAYVLDMLHKRVIVLDPMAGPLGFTNERITIHGYTSNLMLNEFFRCVRKMFKNWSCDTNGWITRYPIIMTEHFPSQHSGLCMSYMLRNFDGDKLVNPLTQESFNMHHQNTLYEVTRLEGNISKTPADALEAIMTAFHVL